MAYVVNRTQYLEINSVPLATPAWRIKDLSRLYGLEVRGDDRILPGADGARPFRRRVTVRTVGLPLLVEGRFTHEGASNSNIWDGLDDNIDHLMTNVVTPATSTAGTRTAVWHRANGNINADVHVEGFEPQGWGQGWVLFLLEISIPAGRFA